MKKMFSGTVERIKPFFFSSKSRHHCNLIEFLNIFPDQGTERILWIENSVMLMFLNASLYTNYLFLAKLYALFQRSHFSLRSKKDTAISSLFVTKVCQPCCRAEPSQKPGCIFFFLCMCP